MTHITTMQGAIERIKNAKCRLMPSRARIRCDIAFLMIINNLQTHHCILDFLQGCKHLVDEHTIAFLEVA